LEDFEIGGPSSKKKKVAEEIDEEENESFYADGLTDEQREIYDIIDQVEDVYIKIIKYSKIML